jgi:endonuclease G, mitochondrial
MQKVAKHIAGVVIVGALIALAGYSALIADDSEFPSASNTQTHAPDPALMKEHVIGGVPSRGNVYTRRGYVIGFDPKTKTPAWVAYHVVPDCRKTPRRRGRFSRFRDDPDISGEARDDDYTGLFGSRGYARGHLAPYGVMGGDRDGDGLYAGLEGESDADDEETVFQGNYLSNIAPQHHKGFNGSPGIWYRLERWIQDDLVRDGGKEVWVFAGCVFGRGTPEKVGPNGDIHVPPAFFKIVVSRRSNLEDELVVLAFLLPHHRKAHGDVQDFLVSVDVIEALTGLDFFHELDDKREHALEDVDTWENWEAFEE